MPSLSIAVSAAVWEPSGARFVAAGGERLPLPDGNFDAVTMFDVLEHIPQPGRAMGEVRRVLIRDLAESIEQEEQ